jgi:hypothetical protein
VLIGSENATQEIAARGIWLVISPIVILGLGPGIHEFLFVDGRVKPGHDGSGYCSFSQYSDAGRVVSGGLAATAFEDMPQRLDADAVAEVAEAFAADA